VGFLYSIGVLCFLQANLEILQVAALNFGAGGCSSVTVGLLLSWKFKIQIFLSTQ